MTTPPEAPPAVRLSEVVGLPPRSTSPRTKQANTYKHREEWLLAATNLLRPIFDKAGSPLPEAGRAAIGFPSKGGKGNCVGECWHATASADQHYEIFIRPDKADPVEVLGILAHELVHAAVPLGSGHGPIYKALALKIGLEGKMRHAMPGMHLQDILTGYAAELGPLPHATLNIAFRESAPRKKQKTNLLKAWCEGVQVEGKPEPCDYVCRVTAVHAKKGAPICGVHETRMRVEWPLEEQDDGEESPSPADDAADTEGVERGFKASRRPSIPPLQPAPGWRETDAREVHPPGQEYRVNLATGTSEVRPAAARERE